MRYLRVKNWDEFQHYKDRNPPWIKLHRSVLDDYVFARLQDASKAHLMLIWLFASTQKNNLVPEDPAFLKKRLSLDKEPDLNLFINHGLLIPEQAASTEPEQDASKVLSLARSREERRGETETEERRDGSAAAPPVDNSPVVEKLPLKSGGEFEVRQSLVAELEPLYPNVDVPATLKEMRGWLLLNESRRKTRQGVKAFIGRWLQTEQEKYGGQETARGAH